MTAVIITGQERWARTGPSGNSDNYWGGGGGGGGGNTHLTQAS